MSWIVALTQTTALKEKNKKNTFDFVLIFSNLSIALKSRYILLISLLLLSCQRFVYISFQLLDPKASLELSLNNSNVDVAMY